MKDSLNMIHLFADDYHAAAKLLRKALTKTNLREVYCCLFALATRLGVDCEQLRSAYALPGDC